MQVDRLSGHWKLVVVASTLTKWSCDAHICSSVDEGQPEMGTVTVLTGLCECYIHHYESICLVQAWTMSQACPDP
jgi:hypothetical protein